MSKIAFFLTIEAVLHTLMKHHNIFIFMTCLRPTNEPNVAFLLKLRTTIYLIYDEIITGLEMQLLVNPNEAWNIWLIHTQNRYAQDGDMNFF